MLKTLCWELEWVRVEDGVPTEAPHVAGGVFRLRRWLLALILAVEGPLVAASLFTPQEPKLFVYPDYDYPYRCGCGIPMQAADYVDPDSTLLVRRLP